MIRNRFDELRLTGDLPSPSHLGHGILELTQHEDHTLEDLTRLIMADPALSGRLIRLANSTETDGRPPVQTVPQAAMRLGAGTTRTVALGFTLLTDERPRTCPSFDVERYWSESLAAAVAAQVLAREKQIFEPAEAFTCALLCDVGKLALARVHPEKYSHVLEQNPDADDREIALLESRAFGITHTEVTAAMMADWGLPAVFREAILNHQHELEGGDDDFGHAWGLVTLLRAARRIATVLCAAARGAKDEWRNAFAELGDAATSLGMDLDELCEICDLISGEWESWGETIGLDTGERFSFSAAAIALEHDDETVAARADPAPASARRPNRNRILLVDDDERMLRLLQHHLRHEGYDVFAAETSEDGLRMALELGPQIVITDWMLPGLPGISLCRMLRQTEAGQKMYVLIVTAREDDEQVVEAFTAGADDYVVKPFNPRILLARVRAGQRVLRMREQVEQSERVRKRQVAELGVLTRRLRAAAMTDTLTELPNRRYAIDRLKQEWESSERTGHPLSVVMVDIDHFKAVNDLHGHDAGDAVLRDVARILRSKSRAGDVLCRLGGEEFLSINVGCDIDQAVTGAERLRAAVEGEPMLHDGLEHRVTISLGVAQRTPEMESVDDLLKAADEALYEAKETGRNRSSRGRTRRSKRSA